MKTVLSAVAALLAVLTPARAQPGGASAAWVQMVKDGAEVRAVAAGSGCPDLRIDGRADAMTVRVAADAAFPPVCVRRLPSGVRQVEVDGRRLGVPVREVRRIVVFGDSGCRIKDRNVQACNDPRAWPFAEVARRAAARRPDLVIHVGDYYYRESPCPVGDLRCEGSPAGDRWEAWSADFFAPAEPLLRAAPWVFARGNHESCSRGGVGWFRLLDAAPIAKACPAASDPLSVPIGGLNLYVVDDADSPDRDPKAADVAAFAGQLDALQAGLAGQPGWIVVHRPVWGLTPVARLGPVGPLNVALNLTEQAAVKGRDLDGVRMVLSGHVHDFSSFDFGPARPAQLVVGTGGDVGEPADSPRITEDIVQMDGLAARRLEFDRFGYMVLDRLGRGADDWSGVFYDASDRPVVRCRLHSRTLRCVRAES